MSDSSYNKNCGKPDDTSVRFDHATGQLLVWNGFKFVAVNPAVPQPAFTAQVIAGGGGVAVGTPFIVPFTQGDFEANIISPPGLWAVSANNQVIIPRDGLYRITYQLNILNQDALATVSSTLLVNNAIIPLVDFPTTQTVGAPQVLEFNGDRLVQLKLGDLVSLQISSATAVTLSWSDLVMSFERIN